jgi:hypothetical protein
MIYFGGIDPGTTGAMSILDEDGDILQLFDYPGEEGTLWKILNDKIFSSIEIKLVALEQAAIMPMERQNAAGKQFRQNPKSLAVFHQNYGIWRMAIAAKGWPVELVHPMRWRKVLDSSVPKHPTKDDLLNYARRRWPGVDLHRKADHNRAEAIMIGHYARLKFLGQIV